METCSLFGYNRLILPVHLAGWRLATPREHVVARAIVTFPVSRKKCVVESKPTSGGRLGGSGDITGDITQQMMPTSVV